MKVENSHSDIITLPYKKNKNILLREEITCPLKLLFVCISVYVCTHKHVHMHKGNIQDSFVLKIAFHNFLLYA